MDSFPCTYRACRKGACRSAQAARAAAAARASPLTASMCTLASPAPRRRPRARAGAGRAPRALSAQFRFCRDGPGSCCLSLGKKLVLEQLHTALRHRERTPQTDRACPGCTALPHGLPVPRTKSKKSRGTELQTSRSLHTRASKKHNLRPKCTASHPEEEPPYASAFACSRSSSSMSAPSSDFSFSSRLITSIRQLPSASCKDGHERRGR